MTSRFLLPYQSMKSAPIFCPVLRKNHSSPGVPIGKVGNSLMQVALLDVVFNVIVNTRQVDEHSSCKLAFCEVLCGVKMQEELSLGRRDDDSGVFQK